MRKIVINQDGHICDEHLNLLRCPITQHLCDHSCAWFGINEQEFTDKSIKAEVLCMGRVIGIIIGREKPHLRRFDGNGKKIEG